MNYFRSASLTFAVSLSVMGLGVPGWAATIPGLFNSGVDGTGATLPSGAVDPHWTLVSGPGVTGPSVFVVTESLFPIVAGPWIASSPQSKWIGPQANQSVGNPPGDYIYRLTFDLSGLEPSSARITGRWTSDNTGPGIMLNGVHTGNTSDGNFGAFGNTINIEGGFVEGVNTLDVVVNNAGTGANPTALRIELSGTADLEAPPGTPPSILEEPISLTVGLLEPASFSVSVYGARPLSYQWRLNGDPIAGAISPSLSIPIAQAADAGAYDVVVTNEWGSVTSQTATLSVVFLSPAQLSYEPLGPSTRRSGLTFSEIMYHPVAREDGRNTEFIEIYNSNPFFEDISGYRLTGDFDYVFPENTIIEGNAFLVVAPVPADVEFVYGIGGVLGGSLQALPNGSGTVRLRKRSGGVVLEGRYSDQPPWVVAADGTGHSLVLARPSYGEDHPEAWEASAVKGGSPGAVDPLPTGPLENVVINEILANTDLANDYLELFNNSTLAADLSGCWLSDDPATNKFRIPDNTILTAQGFAVFTETELGFALQASGETIYLVNSDDSRVLAELRYRGQAREVAFGRYPDGAPRFQELGAQTPGSGNAPPLEREIVINEIMYNPISGDDDDEFVELHNRGSVSVDVSGWRFVDGISFTFPAGTEIAAGGYLAVARNGARLLTNYPGLSIANVVGDYGGTLSNGGERLALAMREAQVVTNLATLEVATNTFNVVVDEVTYVDGGRWTRWSDGGGSSLELVDARADNRLAANWADSDETSKAGWTVVERTGLLELGDGPAPINASVAASQLQAILFGAGEALVDDVEVEVSGVNRVPNSDFEGGMTGWFAQGTHRLSSLETGEGYNSSRSLRLRSSNRGDQAANRLRAPLSSTLSVGQTATMRAKVRWLRGHPEILFRLKGNYLEVFGRLEVPKNLGTPGAVNSQAIPNAGPAIFDVQHRPVLPQANDAIRVSARVTDADGLQSVTLRYRIDPSPSLQSVVMVDDGTQGDALGGDGVFTGAIPGQPAGTIVAFRVESSDEAMPSQFSQFPQDAPTRECLVRVGEMELGIAFGTYRLWMTEGTVNTWGTREALSNEDLDCTWVYGSSRVVYNVGAHHSGSPYTFSGGPVSPVGSTTGFDVIFPEDDPFLRSTHMVTDQVTRDPTGQRERLMYWFLEQYGLPDMYRRHVAMFVNGVRRGTLHDDLQQPGGDTVEEFFFGDSNGTLLKTDCWDEFSDSGPRETGCIDLNALELYTAADGTKKVERYRWTWKPRIADTYNDYTHLFQLVDAANAPDAIYQSSMEGLVDMEHWMRTFAMDDLASFWDAFGNPNAKNTFLYKPTNGRWQLMSWDFDVGLGVFNDPVDSALFPNLNDDAMDRVYTNPAWTRMYWAALLEGVNGFFQTGPGTRIDTLLDAKYAAFQANGITFSSPDPIKTWISQRRSFLLTQLSTVAGSFSVAGPDTISTAGNLVALAGTAPVNVHTITVNGVAYPVRWLSVNEWQLSVPVGEASQQLVVEGIDRLGQPVEGASRTLTVNYTGTMELAEMNVMFSEIMFHPIDPEAEYVEIYNLSSTFSFDLSGWRLNGVDYVFPSGSVITNGQYLVVARNRAAFISSYGLEAGVFGEYAGRLDDEGETLTLFRPGSMVGEELVVDRVTYGAGAPWPSSTRGSGLSLQLIDPRQDNNRPSNWSDGTGWRFFSVVGNPSTAATFFYFWLSGAGDIFIDDVELVQGESRGAGPNLLGNGDFETGVLEPWSTRGNHVASEVTSVVAHGGDFSLRIAADGGGNAINYVRQTITGVSAGTLLNLSFYYLPGTAPGLDYRIDSRFRSFTPVDVAPRFVTPGGMNASAGVVPPYELVWLNEVAPENSGGIVDGAGDLDPWIELFNSGAAPISLDGYSLTDDYGDLGRWSFPVGATILPGEFKLVWADGEPGEGSGDEWHASFRLGAGAGTVALSRSLNGAPQVVDYLEYGGTATDRSFGSIPDGNPFFRRLLYVVTPEAPNDAGFPVAPVFINEWMADNVGGVIDPADQDAEDWFELYNAGDETVDLAGYQLTDDPAQPSKAVIPDGIRIGPRGFLLVWADEESGQTDTNGDLHVSFRLSALGEVIELRAPNGQLVDAVTFGQQTPNQSEGRFPDAGAAPFFMMPEFTPAAPNRVPGLGGLEIILLVVDRDLGTATVTWEAEAGVSYRLQYKEDLSDLGWIDLPGDVVAAGATATKIDPSIGGVGQRFYRVVKL